MGLSVGPQLRVLILMMFVVGELVDYADKPFYDLLNLIDWFFGFCPQHPKQYIAIECKELINRV
jgi:hypothetical protein